ncbi:MAG: hypothetical protein JNL52_12145 [Flavobacteriales bacterium]|nr:hypothetical protein [Flavobacteriales bacterium]
MALTRRSRRWIIVLSVLALLVGGLFHYADRLAANALHHVAALAEKGGHRITFGSVQVSLLKAHIRLEDLNVVPMADSTVEDSAVRYTVHADRIDLRGVELMALLRRNVLHVGHIELHGPSVLHSFVPRGLKQAAADSLPNEKPNGKGLPLDVLRVDTLLIADATGRSQDRSADAPALSIGVLDLLITGIRLVPDAQGRAVPDVASVQLDLHKAETHLKPYYTLTLDSARIRIPQDTAILFGVRFTPDVAPKQYHKLVDHQVELYRAVVDTLMLSGFDLSARLRDGTVRAQELRVAGVALDIHRDKTLPLGPVHPKPLLADRITRMHVPVQVDTVRVLRGTVTYHERLKPGADFGSISFTHIAGQLTGFSNLPQPNAPDLHLVGSAHVGHARAQVDIRMPMASAHTTVDVHVRLKGFPATDMNRMTDELLHVTATQGTIHLVDMRMRGDDQRATGTIDLHYEDLAMQLGTEIKHAKLLTKVANMAVRGSNMPNTKGYRKGQFTVEKPMNAGVFKYIWISLRTGMIEVMLPQLLLKQMHKQQEKKGRKEARKEGRQRNKKGA